MIVLLARHVVSAPVVHPFVALHLPQAVLAAPADHEPPLLQKIRRHPQSVRHRVVRPHHAEAPAPQRLDEARRRRVHDHTLDPSSPRQLLERVDVFLIRFLPALRAGIVVVFVHAVLARTRFWPDQITVYASKRVLDSLRFVKTVPINIVNFGDTVIQTVALEKIKGVKMVPDRVRIGLYPDIMTEESIDVPVGSINMPEGKVLRTFPSRVKVNFIVGASMFRNITADQFQVVVDYNELMEHPSDKCNIYLKASPHSVRSAKLSISQVDYLIEQQ